MRVLLRMRVLLCVRFAVYVPHCVCMCLTACVRLTILLVMFVTASISLDLSVCFTLCLHIRTCYPLARTAHQTTLTLLVHHAPSSSWTRYKSVLLRYAAERAEKEAVRDKHLAEEAMRKREAHYRSVELDSVNTKKQLSEARLEIDRANTKEARSAALAATLQSQLEQTQQKVTTLRYLHYLSVSLTHTHTHSSLHVLVVMINSKELKIKISHAHSLILSQSIENMYLLTHSSSHAVVDERSKKFKISRFIFSC